VKPSDEMRIRLAYDAIFAEAAEEASEAPEPDSRITPAVHARIEAQVAEGVAAIGERRLARARAERLARRPAPVRPSLLDATRDALLARLRAFEAQIPGVLVAQHRHLATLTDDDLRTLIADLESMRDDDDAPG
jgi:hypothetical protein